MTDIAADIITEVVTEIVTEVAEFEPTAPSPVDEPAGSSGLVASVPEPPAAEPEAAPPAARSPASADAEERPAETPGQDPEPETPAAAHALAYPTGSAAQQVLDAFLDSDSDQLSMNDIKAALSHLAGNTVEQAVRRLHAQGRLLRVAPGVYRLGDVPSAQAARPAEPVRQPQPESAPTDEEWLAALEAHLINPASWDVAKLGPPPVSPDHRIPADIFARFADRVRKRQARRRDAEVAAARQAEADRALRDSLLATCRHGSRQNYAPDLVSADLAPIRALLTLGVPFDCIRLAVQWRTETEVLASWRDERLLRKAWEFFGRLEIIPQLMKAGGSAPQKPVDASEASPAGQVPTDAENAPAAHQRGSVAIPGDELAPLAEAEAQAGNMGQDHIDQAATTPEAVSPQEADERVFLENGQNLARPPAADRASILAAFRRGPAPPQPAPQPQPAQPDVGKPWFAGSNEPARDDSLSDDAARFLLEGWRAGNVTWSRKHGPPPGSPGCKIPSRILREFGYA
jgi:hypothetical protein